MKRKISSFLFGLLFLAGFGLLAYPTISNQWNTYRQSKLISNYDTVVSQMTEEDFEEAWAAARSYNQTFEQNSIRSDVFGIIASLPSVQQTVIRMRHIEGLEIADIAKITGSTPGSIRVALSRARQSIKEIFMQHQS